MLPEDRDLAYLWNMLEAAQRALRYESGQEMEGYLADDLVIVNVNPDQAGSDLDRASSSRDEALGLPAATRVGRPRPSREHGVDVGLSKRLLVTHRCVLRSVWRWNMATNLAIDDQLIVEAQAIGGAPTKNAAVTEALKEYIQRRKQIEINSLFGQVDYDRDYDYKKNRSRG